MYIQQSVKLLDDIPDLVKQIGNRSHICYRKEPKEDETAFVKGLVSKGHMSCLEMGRIILVSDSMACFSKYLDIIPCYAENRTWYHIVSGSARAFIELFSELPMTVKGCLSANYPVFFPEVPYYPYGPGGIISCKPITLERAIDVRPDHEADFIWQAVEIITNRSVSHEIVRHRPCSFLQESQRYVDEAMDDIKFIEPIIEGGDTVREELDKHFEEVGNTYRKLRFAGNNPEKARIVLPNEIATKIIVYASIRQWGHILALRDSPKADIYMRQLMALLKPELENRYHGKLTCLPIKQQKVFWR
jgi:thymidylate synthase (FAD)